MKNILLSLFISLSAVLITSSVSMAGRGYDQGNGGYLVRCPSDFSQSSLDYVLAKPNFDQSVLLRDVRTVEESFQRMGQLIDEKIPQFSLSFKAFVADFKNKDASHPYVWRETDYKFPSYNDQDFTEFPADCRPQTGFEDSFQMRQAIARIQLINQDQAQVFFYYNKTLISVVKPLQQSFLFTHEWLWSISKQAKKNRMLNYFLHSDLIEKLSAEEVAAKLKDFGFQP